MERRERDVRFGAGQPNYLTLPAQVLYAQLEKLVDDESLVDLCTGKDVGSQCTGMTGG